MTITALPLVPDATLTNADANYYTCPVNTTAVVKRAVFTNTSASAVTITANVVRSGGSVAASNQIITSQPIAPQSTYVSPELAGLTLSAGDAIHAVASANSVVNFMASGIQIV
ncbi:hypothetical protein [Paraburkholderia rhynchosiae]|uniref:Uncharacterized protein n=1 Tax=Paraburkholderia rhynchosiae TaxID=487049 RepID=A0A2N7W9F5_9BURK|nr:hypothetical protein [Paraburkholderia rhynchosiae]PMS26009.1 hypothetical protein C0Z16_28150 [Paraburkholderia rhynchosiae]CAB3731146.1 hypothetical protein LMG27174_05809 [Paraburkholderia rhynchosiae]